MINFAIISIIFQRVKNADNKHCENYEYPNALQGIECYIKRKIIEKKAEDRL